MATPSSPPAKPAKGKTATKESGGGCFLLFVVLVVLTGLFGWWVFSGDSKETPPPITGGGPTGKQLPVAQEKKQPSKNSVIDWSTTTTTIVQTPKKDTDTVFLSVSKVEWSEAVDVKYKWSMSYHYPGDAIMLLVDGTTYQVDKTGTWKFVNGKKVPFSKQPNGSQIRFRVPPDSPADFPPTVEVSRKPN